MKKQKKTNFKQESGITLIALVITIIVILILAIVTVNMAIDGDGLFGKANAAVEGWDVAVKEEETSLLDLFEKLELIQKTKDEDASTIKQKEDDETVHIIQSIEDLVILANNVNTGTTYEGETFELELSLDFNSRDSYIDPDKENFLELGDINGNGTVESLMVELTTGKGFIPIGKDTATPFKGSVEGNNRTIYGLYIQYEDNYYYAGLIGYADKVTINNLSLKDVNISGGQAAAFIGQTKGDLICENLYCSGKITGKYDAGALTTDVLSAGYNSSDPNPNIKISNFTNEAELESTSGYAGAISSFVYYTNIELENCTNTGNITADSNAAGLIAYTNNQETNENIILNNCVNSGDITGNNDSAGIIGKVQNANKIEVNNCKNSGNISNSRQYYNIAGIIATVNAKIVNIDNCKNLGNITEMANCYGAGIIKSIWGVDEISITNSSNEGSITGKAGLIGQVSGLNIETSTFYTENCFNKGNLYSEEYSGSSGMFGEINTMKNVNVNQCYNSGNIELKYGGFSGGIIGATNISNGNAIEVGRITNCYNTGNINAEKYGSGQNVAGIVGVTGVEIENCYNKGNIKSGSVDIGGIIGHGRSKAIIKKCYNEGDLYSEQRDVGGISGYICQSIESCYNKGRIEGYYSVGGISGASAINTKNCYNEGDIHAHNTGSMGGYLGGIAGSGNSAHVIQNVYNTGKLTSATGTSMSGISYNGGTITNAYNLGQMEDNGDGTNVGSISGISANVVNSYYLKGTYPIGIYDKTNPDNSGEKTETEIKQLMIDNLVSLEEWELGEDGLPKLVF